jgi:hypothetical protein
MISILSSIDVAADGSGFELPIPFNVDEFVSARHIISSCSPPN